MAAKQTILGAALRNTIPRRDAEYNGYAIDHKIINTRSDLDFLTSLRRRRAPIVPNSLEYWRMQAGKKALERLEKRYDMLQIPPDSPHAFRLPTAKNNMWQNKWLSIHSVWKACYLAPRVSPIAEDEYLEWAEQWLSKGVPVDHENSVPSIDIEDKSSPLFIARRDIVLPCLMGDLALEVMEPTVWHIDRINTQDDTKILAMTGDRPTSDPSHQSIPLYRDMARTLMLRGLPEGLFISPGIEGTGQRV